MVSDLEIPVVDLDAPSVVDQFRHAYGEIGFGYIIGHGGSKELVEDAFAAARAFHDLPEVEKQMLSVHDS